MHAHRKAELILVVDDSPEDRTAIVFYLRQAAVHFGIEFRFRESEKGQEGLAACRAEAPACVILDHHLPDMSGVDFLMRLRGSDGEVPVPVVMLTDSGDRALALVSLRAGAQEFLPKRLMEPDMLLRAVQSAQSRFILRLDGRRSEIALADTKAALRLSVQVEADRRKRSLEKSHADLAVLAGDLAKARDAAEGANRAKSRFLAGMSHELRTPLNAILGYTQLLRIDGGLNAVQAGRVDAMLDAGTHLLELIHCVLDLSEIETEKAELQTGDVNLRRVTAACLDLVRPSADAKEVALALEIFADVPAHVEVDASRLRQVLFNLLGNAVKFTATGEVRLRLRAVAGGATLRIEVADTGPGIPRGQRHRLFQVFERLDGAAGRSGEGAGLGLFLAAQCAKLMGGHLGHDDNPGGGSLFWLEVPMVASAVAPPAAPLSLALAPGAIATDFGLAEATETVAPALHVLVVDDVFINRDIAASMLHASGLTVTCAEGGAEAVAAAALTDFDVVLMDVRMPHMDGMEATRRIRAMDAPRGRVPIVALTAQAFTEQVAECREAGMDAHLVKPYDRDMLLAAVLRAAETGRAHRRRGAPAERPAVSAIPPPP